MPDSASLIWGLIFGSIGFGYLVYSKNNSRAVFRYTGIALMIYPFFVDPLWAVVTIGLVLLLVPKFVDL